MCAQRRLIWVFAGRTVMLLGLSWGGSNVFIHLYWRKVCHNHWSSAIRVPAKVLLDHLNKGVQNPSSLTSSFFAFVGGTGLGATLHSYLYATKFKRFIRLSRTTLSSISLSLINIYICKITFSNVCPLLFFSCRQLLRPSLCGRHLGKKNGHKSTYVKVWRCTFSWLTMFLTKKPWVKLFECKAEVDGWLTQAYLFLQRPIQSCNRPHDLS